MNLAPANIRVLIPLSPGYMNRGCPPYVSLYYYRCVRILLQASSYSYVRVLIALYVSSYYMCPHTTIYVSSHRLDLRWALLILRRFPSERTERTVLLYICPHTGKMHRAWSGLNYYMCVVKLLYVSSYDCRMRLILLYVSSNYYIRVLILQNNVSSFYYICVLILLYTCPHTAQ
jgi:hypothetical protein